MVEVLEVPPKRKRTRKPKPPIVGAKKLPTPILSIDASYENTGIGLIGDDQHKYAGKALFWTNLLLTSYHTKWQKRQTITEQLHKILVKWKPKSIVMEAVDLYRNGRPRPTTALVLITLASCIIDVAMEYDPEIKIYCITTKHWKDNMLREKEDRRGKQGTINYMTAFIGAPIYDDNIADALCLGLCSYQNPHLLKLANI